MVCLFPFSLLLLQMFHNLAIDWGGEAWTGKCVCCHTWGRVQSCSPHERWTLWTNGKDIGERKMFKKWDWVRTHNECFAKNVSFKPCCNNLLVDLPENLKFKTKGKKISSLNKKKSTLLSYVKHTSLNADKKKKNQVMYTKSSPF